MAEALNAEFKLCTCVICHIDIDPTEVKTLLTDLPEEYKEIVNFFQAGPLEECGEMMMHRPRSALCRICMKDVESAVIAEKLRSMEINGSPANYSTSGGPSPNVKVPCDGLTGTTGQPSCKTDNSADPATQTAPQQTSKKWPRIAVIAGLSVLGGAATIAAAPVAVAALGFGTGGIAAGSLAASMMSAAATTGVGGGVVAVLQSVGAVGFSVAGTTVLAATGAATGAGIGGLINKVTEKKDSSETSANTGNGPDVSGEASPKQGFEDAATQAPDGAGIKLPSNQQ